MAQLTEAVYEHARLTGAHACIDASHASGKEPSGKDVKHRELRLDHARAQQGSSGHLPCPCNHHIYQPTNCVSRHAAEFTISTLHSADLLGHCEVHFQSLAKVVKS